ncbi:hypothetical protein N9B67_01760 [Algibacter sp.]|nr:LamG domain-containing protein [Algibacter sp.]MDA9069787.1 hypothetical protein [Algibacter sp.]MDA9775024.1 hypothetical protein [Algibacter sp.]
MKTSLLFKTLFLIVFLSGNMTYSQDSDGDGILDSVDLDDDNDGIIDTYECSSAIQFGEPSLLTAQDLADVKVGEKVIFSNALLFQNQDYDLVVTVTSKQGDFSIDCSISSSTYNLEGIKADSFDASQNEYFTYSFDLVYAGTATSANPIGIPATLYGLILESRDIDTSSGRDYTEIAGFNASTVTSSITPYLSATTNLEQDGFLNGAALAYTNYRLDPTIAGSPTTWVDEPDDGNTQGDDPDFYLSMEFDQFSHVDLLFGATGTHTNTGLRLTSFGVISVCDFDDDGSLDTVDIDSDNDGIPDNVEAQPTMGYIPPSNATGGSIKDDNSNGLDDVYESAMGGRDLNDLEDTDGDKLKDYLDSDSDNDGYLDIQENGMADTYTAADVDEDGLGNAFETNGVMDTFLDVNEDIEDPTDLSILPDADFDLTLGGDLDYRDMFDVNPPPIASIDFDGVDDYLSRDAFIDGMSDVTLMAWIKTDSGNSTNMVIAGEDTGCKLWLENGNKPKFTIRTAGNSEVSINCGAINFDEWHHVTGTYTSATGVMSLFIDGAFMASANVGSTGAVIENTEDSNGDFEIGRLSTDDVANHLYFKGDIDEVRVFDIVLTDSQIEQLVYQEIEDNSGNVKGAIVAKDITDMGTGNTVPWANLIAYYPMTNIVMGKTSDYSSYDKELYINYISTIQDQTAPMPYVASNPGSWSSQSTWLHGNVWDIENTATNKDWSIVKISSNVVACHSIKTSGLIIDSNTTLKVHSDNLVENSWYFELNGTLDLEDDSQLIQTINSDLVTSANGKILRRQEGEANPFRYNYWASPVGATGATSLTDNNDPLTNNANNTPFNLGMIRDDSGICSFTSGYTGSGSISTYWLYTFINGLTYWDWAQLSTSTALKPGVGYTQKGTGVVDSEQQYIFQGKPNNGTILINVTDVGGSGSEPSVSATNYLLGNPYPSALDVHKFIDDNVGVINGTLQLWQQWSGDSHYLNEYNGGYAQVNKTGCTRACQFVGFYGANNGSQDGTKTPSRYLPIGQGFITEIIADGTVEFNNSQRIFIKEVDADGTGNNGSVFMKSAGTKNKSTSESKDVNPFKKFRLEFNSVTGPETRRELLLGFSELTTDAFDYGYDAENSEINNNDLCLNLDGKNMNIQAYGDITDDKVVPLNFKSSGDNSFEIKITQTENIDASQAIYLKDNLTGTYFDLTQDTPYQFSSNLGIFNERFEIVFQSEAQTLNVEESQTSENFVYYQRTEQKLYVKKLNASVRRIALVNMLGQTALEFNNVSQEELRNGLSISNLSSGAYVAYFRTDTHEEVLTKKIVVN